VHKLLFALALLVFGVGLSAQDLDLSFQSEVGLGTSFLTLFDYPAGRFGGPFQERNEIFSFVFIGTYFIGMAKPSTKGNYLRLAFSGGILV